MLSGVTPHRKFPLAAAIGLFAIGFAVLGWPWFSGAVTIPYDGKSTFYTQLAFLARSLADGQSPFWTPNVYAGWPQIADPQSLIFSPFHVLLALFDPTPSFRLADGVAFAYLFLGGVGVILLFRDRGWHVGGALVAAFAFSFGASNASRLQHIGPLESLCYWPLAQLFLMRALERAPSRAAWRDGALSGLFSGLILLGRDQVSLIAIYVLAGYVLWHWLAGTGRVARLRASLAPLAAGAAAGVLVAAVPLVLTMLLAADSNRPEIGYFYAGRGSLHPADLMMLVFADLYGAANPRVNYWGPPSFAWHETIGHTDLFLAQNVGQLYAGAVAIVAVIGLGIVRGQLWAREVRCFTVAALLVLLYALGKYTPAFYFMYELLPGVSLFRRPADAGFMFGGLLAILGGYLVHRWLTGQVPASKRWQRIADAVLALALLATAVALALMVGKLDVAIAPIVSTIVCVAGAIGALCLSRRLAPRGALAAAAILAAASTADLAWNNGPTESTGLPPAKFDALRAETKDETVALLKSRLAAAAAPDRRDRVELIGVEYHWPNIGLVHGFDHLLGHNPLRLSNFENATNAPDTVAGPDQREFSPLLPSFRSTLENLFGVRFIAISVPIEQIDRSLKPGDLNFIARTNSAYIYENPRALPRVMMVGRWQVVDFEQLVRAGGWPNVDPRVTVLLERSPDGLAPAAEPVGTAKIVSYRNTEVVIEVENASAGLLVLNDVWHPWWRASVDGLPAAILKANVLFRAVVVPRGKHIVRFSFHPIAGALEQLKQKLFVARQ
jgi:hypothetical protein